MFALALGAAGRHLARETAVVALQPLTFAGQSIFVRRLVMRKRNRAVLAIELFAAGAANHGEGVAAAIKQHQRLLAALKRSLDLRNQRAREQLLLARLLKFGSHVDELDRRQRAIHNAFAQIDACVLALRRIVPALKRRSCRAQHRNCSGALGAHHRNVARVVAGSLLLLVALVVLFVDEDEAEVGRGRKDGGAGPHHNRRVAAADASPLLAALLRRKRGVHERDFLPEGPVKQPHRLRGQPDLRH